MRLRGGVNGPASEGLSQINNFDRRKADWSRYDCMPPPQSVINDPEHWRSRAEEARTIAEQMNDLPSKEAMLRIAKDYDRLAKRTEERAQREGL